MKRFYLFGKNIQTSFSPEIHTYCFSKLGFNADYVVWEREIDECKERLKDQDFGGASVTIPYKTCFQSIQCQSKI